MGQEEHLIENPAESQIEIDDLQESDGFGEGELNIHDKKKIILEKADRSLSELHRWYKTGRIKVDPEWQRNYVWDRNKASKLIESFLIDIPVPVIYLAKGEDQKYEVIDGLQRLTTIFKFFDSQIQLKGIELLPELLNKTFKDLPQNLQNKLEDCTLRSFELFSNDKDIHFIVFERINTGSVKLNDMEIRNCLFRGSLNNLLKEMSQDENFCKALSQKGYKDRMQDRALILRFFAFYERTYHKCDKGLKRFLNEFLETYQNATEEKIKEYRRVFDNCMRASLTVFGDRAFRLKSDLGKTGSHSSGEWSSRPNAAIFQVISTSFSKYNLGDITRAADSIYEEYLDLITTDELWVDRVRRATGETSRLHYTFNEWQRRLENIMESAEKNDPKRLFSRNIKQELFYQNQTCGICGQKISLLDDAVMDHDKRYWDAGKTIPENAQLSHRYCNSSKG